jgi:hypothetical protein
MNGCGRAFLRQGGAARVLDFSNGARGRRLIAELKQMTLSLDQFGLRRELRGLAAFDREWFQQMATATALSEGRASTITSNIPEILDCARRLAAHLGAVAEVIERGDVVDIIILKEGSPQ